MAVEIAQQWVHDADYASACPRTALAAAAFVGSRVLKVAKATETSIVNSPRAACLFTTFLPLWIASGLAHAICRRR
ncbi:MAG TPA: hypothetical protein VNG89_17185, partial [Vicinamibacterales bacterium]|nr:hypothetical protein [Vicinamibacterales bacterium]